MKQFIFIFSIFICSTVTAQRNNWQPDSTAYEYLSKGDNLSQFWSNRLSKIEVDSAVGHNNPRSIKWTLPANSGTAILYLYTIDLDLRNKNIYTVCKRAHAINGVNVFVNTASGGRYKVKEVTKETQNGFNLPSTEWHQAGENLTGVLVNPAELASLEHVTYISFEATNCEEITEVWIDEIKTITARGPVASVNFNRYRDQADTLLTPYLLSKGIRANIDFNYSFARDLTVETYNAIPFVSIGLERIDTLVHQLGWSCSSHGSYYDQLPFLSPQARYRLFALDSFVNAGFNASWCFAIPKDNITPAIMKEISDYGQYKSVRKQSQDVSNLPISNPFNFGFFRPTSAIAGPNLNGNPLLIGQMKTYVDSCIKHKGLIVLDFGTIVTTPSPLYTDVETTMQSDALSLIDYVDSLGLPFLTFEDLFKDDSSYVQKLTASNDFYQLKGVTMEVIPVLENDMIPTGSIPSIVMLDPPTFGTVNINGNSVEYTPGVSCFSIDQFSYVLSNGSLSDTAVVFVRRMGNVFSGEKTFFCNPNLYNVVATATGGQSPYNYLWSTGATTDTVVLPGGSSQHYLTITDANGCTLKDSLLLPNRPSSVPYVFNSIQCSAGVPTCHVSGNDTILWYSDSTGGTLLQQGGSTYLSIVDSTTTFYVCIDYGTCVSNRVPITVTVKAPDVTITIESDSVTCVGNVVKYRANSDEGLLYAWRKDGVLIPGATSWKYLATSSGLYSVDVIRPEDTCTTTSLAYAALIVDSARVFYQDSLIFCAGDSLLLSTYVSPSFSYQWFRNGQPIANSNAAAIWVFDEADFTVEISGPSSCLLTSEISSTVVNCTVGINQLNAPYKTLTVYPSPASDKLFIRSSQFVNGNSLLRIFDITGRLLLDSKPLLQQHEGHAIDISNLLSGNYIIEVQSGENVFHGKFVKQ
ncbi:MAG: T9SS type A sorting domain-containing protein [Bacteroidetes bacterium]|nr:T9SS type A sorting domain-containing protein [Bacteroidota bacterium]